jgi:hypothetical protein
MANTEGTGTSGSNPANAAAVAKGQAAAEAAPTAPAPSDAEAKSNAKAAAADAPKAEVATVEADDAPRKYGKVFVADPGIIAPDAVEVHPDAEGGTSFDYGKIDGDTEASKAEKRAADINAYETALAVENPNKVIYRAAGTSGDIGGESFDYGQKPKSE